MSSESKTQAEDSNGDYEMIAEQPPPVIPPPSPMPVMQSSDVKSDSSGGNPYSIRSAPPVSVAPPISAPGPSPVVNTFIPSSQPAQISPTLSPTSGVLPASSQSPFSLASDAAVDIGAAADGGDGEGEAGPGIWGWIAGSEMLNKFAEKAKTSVDSVINTLDPQMKDYMASSGSVDLVVTADDELTISALRTGFQRGFAQVTARGLGSPATSALIPVLPDGFKNAIKAAEVKIQSLRQSGLVIDVSPVIGVQSFIVDLARDNNWYEMTCLTIDDVVKGVKLTMYTQPVLLPSQLVATIKSETPKTYPLSGQGFGVSITQALAMEGPIVSEADAFEQLTGVPRSRTLAEAAHALATAYRSRLILLPVAVSEKTT